MVRDSHRMLAMWRKYFTQILNVHEVRDARQTKYIQQNHYFLNPINFSFNWLLKS